MDPLAKFQDAVTVLMDHTWSRDFNVSMRATLGTIAGDIVDALYEIMVDEAGL